MILGLDIGTHSIGWALLATNDGKTPSGIIDAGVRVFPAGVDGNVETGREEPRNTARRAARSARRLNWREGRRHRRCVSILQAMGLLPSTPDLKPPTLDGMFRSLDQKLRPAGVGHRESLTWLYGLRARALDERLEPFELGRAIVHLLKRRGFQSNRKQQADADEDLGEVKQSINDLQDAMVAAGHRTVGEHFASLDPEQERIRARWLGREAIRREFDAIIDSQRTHHPVLQQESTAELARAAFFQRPLKPVKSGRCSLEPDRHRARQAELVAQRFRLLQEVANLQVLHDGPPRPLTPDERSALVGALEARGDLTWAAVRREIGQPKTVKFNFELGGAKKLIGDRTSAALRDIFGDRWDAMDRSEREQVVEDLLSFEKVEAIKRRGRRRWGLDLEASGRFAALSLEPGYARLSREAMKTLIPDMEQGVHYATARKKWYPESFSADEPLDRLPPVRVFDRELRNPTVERTLSELRRVVNGLVARYGRPERVRIELGRDLKRSRDDRQRMTRELRSRESERDSTRDFIRENARIQHPTRQDVLKVRLAEECNWECPFTGKRFGWVDLFGSSPSVDVEHIIPFSQSLDDSYLNKTLCLHEENRNVKRNRTPWVAYGSTDRWEDILGRVERFRGDAARAKLQRFMLDESAEEIFEEFSSRQLNDTRYASRLAMDYLGTLFGGRQDADGILRVQATTGGLTAHLRRGLQLEGILSGDGAMFKNRSDHRHHAVDAVTIALVDPGMVQRMARRAEESWRGGDRRSLTPVAEPWPNFMRDVSAVIEAIVVSHRSNGRLAGALHEETNYSRERDDGTGPRRTVRKPLADLTIPEVDRIVDPPLRALIQSELDARGQPPVKAFAESAPPVTLRGRDGRERRIRRVRIAKPVQVTAIGPSHGRRWVKPGSNHHMAIHEVQTDRGPKWESSVVTLLEATERRRTGRPVIDRGNEPGQRFVCSLRSGDSVLLRLEGEGDLVCTVNTVSGNSVEFTRHSDARMSSEIRKLGKDGGRLRRGLGALQECFVSKVDVLPTGELRTRHD